MYQGNSVVDYLNSTGQKSDFASRAQVAASKGIQGYAGTAEQNTQLLNILRGASQTAQPAQQPQASPQQARPQTSTPAPVQSSGPQSIQDLVSMGYYGYQGWDPTAAMADFRATGGAGKGGPSGGGSGLPSMQAPSINLPELYKTLYDKSGVSNVEQRLSDETRAFNDAMSKINDNPFLSEANRVGRGQKLQTDFNNATAATRAGIATKKADIETQLNLQTKQFDIQSQQAQQALSQFNSLLESGALDNASGEDIANITRSTGISSGMIQSAINAKKLAGYSTEVKSFDDGFEEGFTIYTIDQTGNIVNTAKQVTGKSAKGGQYSSDPKVSAFIKNSMSSQANISDIWNEAGQGY